MAQAAHIPKPERKKLGKKTQGRKKGFGQLHVPSNREGLIHAQVWMHTQRRPEKVLNFHLWLTFKLCAREKK